MEYHENGKIKAEGFLHQGFKQGKWIYYFNDGKKEKEINYNNGKECGKFFRWYSNGNLEIESESFDGKNHGVWKEYYENGILKEIGKYDNGQYTPIDFWDESGNQLMKDGTGKKVEKFGATEHEVYEQYYEKGKFVREVKISATGYRGFNSGNISD